MQIRYTKKLDELHKAYWLYDLCHMAYNQPTKKEIANKCMSSCYLDVYKNHPDYMFVVRYKINGQGYTFFVWSGTLKNKYYFGKEGNLNIFPIQEGMYPEGLRRAWKDHENYVQYTMNLFPDDHYVFTGHSRGSVLAGMAAHYCMSLLKTCDYVGFATPTIGNKIFAKSFRVWMRVTDSIAIRINTKGDIVAHNKMYSWVDGTHIGTEYLLPGSFLSKWRIISRIIRHTPRKYKRIINKIKKQNNLITIY